LIIDSPTNTTLVLLLSQYCNSGSGLNTWYNQSGIHTGLFTYVPKTSV